MFWDLIEFVVPNQKCPLFNRIIGLKWIKEAFHRWIEDYNFNHSNKALDRECAAGVYVASLRRLTEEELEFILVHEEPRKVLKTGSITYYGQYYRVPDEYIGRRVWTKLRGETLFIESAKKVIAQYQIKHDKLDEPRWQFKLGKVHNSNLELQIRKSLT